MLLNKDEIIHVIIDEIPSTNEYLKENYQSLENNTFISTNFQTAGRGQFKRVWEAEKDKNILLSWLIKDSKNDIYKVKKLVTKAVLKILNKHNIAASFKHPNDIYYKDSKLAGILIETKGNKIYDYIIVGIGLNVNQEKFTDQKAISMFNLTKLTYDINKLKNELIKELLKISN